MVVRIMFNSHGRKPNTVKTKLNMDKTELLGKPCELVPRSSSITHRVTVMFSSDGTTGTHMLCILSGGHAAQSYRSFPSVSGS